MAFRRQAIANRPGRKLDNKSWSFIPFFGTSFAGDATFVGGSILFLVPATILRIRGAVQFHFDAAKQVGDEINITLGLAVASTDAVAAGAGSMPDPGGEPEFPWLWWGDFFLHAESTGAQEVWGLTSQRVVVDSKAMRKVKPGQSLVWVGESSQQVGAPATFLDFMRTRVLIGT